METVSIVWGSLPVLFLVMVLVMVARENRTGRRGESPIDPLVRLSRPAAGRRPSDMRSRGIESGRISNVLPGPPTVKLPGQRTLKQSERQRP